MALSLGVVDDAVDLYLAAPEAVGDVLASNKVVEVESAPAVEADSAELAENHAGFVLSVRPESG